MAIYVAIVDEIFILPFKEKDGYVFVKDIVEIIRTPEGKKISTNKLKQMLKKLDVDVKDKIPIKEFLFEVVNALPYLDIAVKPEDMYQILKYHLFFSYYVLESIDEKKFKENLEKLNILYKDVLSKLEEIYQKTPDGISIQNGRLTEFWDLGNGVKVYKLTP